MYAEMILRNKRFKPSFPVREPVCDPQLDEGEQGLELADLSNKELVADDQLDELAV